MISSLESLYKYAIDELSDPKALNDKKTIRLDALILLLYASDTSKEQFYTHQDMIVDECVIKKLKKILRERKKGFCIAGIIGKKEFYKYSFITNKYTLTPRPDSEVIVEKGIEFVRISAISKPKILDICTGTGCIGLSIAKDLSENGINCELTLSDINTKALEVAKLNCSRLEIDTQVIKSNLFSSFKGKKFNLITANPPYIAEKSYRNLKMEVKREPKIALIAKDEGYFLIKKIIRNACRYLDCKGCVIIEMDSRQIDNTIDYIKNYNYSSIEILYDLSGNKRGIKAIYGKKETLD